MGECVLRTFIVNYWLELVFGMITSWMGLAYHKLIKKFQTAKTEQEAMQNGMQALLRDRIIQTYNHYTAEGRCPIYARENLLDLYKGYHALGGNGTITHLVEELQKLPTEIRNGKDDAEWLI
ncbi:hypothetical protein U6B65_13135 [Oscillospiraceae bacterium MB08-C2-2]|nr:hypothetical protein U6B65_13135 [Oscillospiraceae bacterium MB08-C2-2]